MSNPLILIPAAGAGVAIGEMPLPAAADDAESLVAVLAGCRRVLCAIEPDAVGRRILARVGALLAGRDCRLGVVSALRFELPVDAVACIWPTPLDRRARLIVERQREVDRLVGELGLRDAEIFATAGTPSRDIRDVARLWHADIVLCPRSAGTGLRSAGRRAKGGFAVAALDDDGRPLRLSAIARLFGG